MASRQEQPPAWHAQAACAQSDVDPLVFTPISPEEVEIAKKACATCVVRQTCLDDIPPGGAPTQIRGGFTPEERQQMGL